METGLIHLHSFLRWVALLVIVISLIKNFDGMRRNSAFTASDNWWSLITLIVFHTQLVLGFVLYFMQGWYLQLGNMSDALVRFFSMEHMLGMVAAIVLVTVGRIGAKSAPTGGARHKKQFWYFLFALILVIISIPWPFRTIVGAGRTWFPGM